MVNLQYEDNNEVPLELQALIKGQRSSAIVMAILCVLSIYFIPLAIFYIVMAFKLKPQLLPNRGLIKAAAIVTLPLCLGIIPIIIDIEFWKMNGILQKYEEEGAKAFTSDKEYSAAEPKRKKGKIVALSILLPALAILVIFIIIAMATSNSLNMTTGTDNITNNTNWTVYNSTKFAFKASFPGLPIASNSSITTQGIDVPTTTYEKDLGSKYYAIQVASYPSQFDMSDINARLEGTLNGSVQSTTGATLSTSNYLTFNGYEAIKGVISVPNNGKPMTMYELAFLKGNDLYILLDVGASSSENSAFTSSFSFD